MSDLLRRFRVHLIFVAAFAFLAVWYFVGRHEVRMLRAAKKVHGPSDVAAFTSKYRVSLFPLTPGGIFEATYDSQIPPVYKKQHYFRWAFDENGHKIEYHRDTYLRVFRWGFFSYDSQPPSGE